MTELPKITAADAGCWLDGSQGWHNAYRVVDRAEGYGFTVPPEYATALYRYRTNGHGAHEDDWEAVNGQGELSDMATDYLQERAPEGFEFHWDAGELSLVESWQVCENGCTEDERCTDHESEN